MNISAIGSFVVAALALLMSFVSMVQKNSSTSATQMAKLEVKLDAISDDLKELKNDFSSQRHKMDELKEKVIVIERDQKTIWKHIDVLQDSVDSLQKGNNGRIGDVSNTNKVG